MTDSNNNSVNSAGIDKQALYGDYRDFQKRKDSLYMKAAHKSLDIADDDVDINARTDNSRHGIGALGAVAIAAVSGGIPLLGAGALWLAGVFDKPDPVQVVAPVQPSPQPGETKTRIIHDDWSIGEPVVE